VLSANWALEQKLLGPGHHRELGFKDITRRNAGFFYPVTADQMETLVFFCATLARVYICNRPFNYHK